MWITYILHTICCVNNRYSALRLSLQHVQHNIYRVNNKIFSQFITLIADIMQTLFRVHNRGLCDELITRPEKSHRLWCVVVCDIESSWMRTPWPTEGCCPKYKKWCWRTLRRYFNLGSRVYLYTSSQFYAKNSVMFQDKLISLLFYRVKAFTTVVDDAFRNKC